MWNQYRGNAQKQGHSGSVDEVLGPSGNLSVQLWKRSGPTFAGFVSSPIITSKGVAIVGDLDARVYAVQVNTGGLLWSTAQALGEYLSSSAFGLRTMSWPVPPPPSAKGEYGILCRVVMYM